MAVERIEEYKQQNGVNILKVILKPTRAFPNGSYFYAPSEAINLVNKYAWYLHTSGRNQVYVTAADNGSICYEVDRRHQDNVLFHTKLFEFYNNYTWQDYIDHINHVEYDNADQNLEAVTRQQNNFNKLSRGYIIATYYQTAYFQAKIRIDGRTYYPFKPVRNEADACSIQNYLEQVWLREKLGTKYYMFDFFKYRRGSEDILDLERTGVISEEEAIYHHVMRYADNAWFYLRYGLQDYFKQYRIPIPQYRLDDMGFMIHPITGECLCPI